MKELQKAPLQYQLLYGGMKYAEKAIFRDHAYLHCHFFRAQLLENRNVFA